MVNQWFLGHKWQHRACVQIDAIYQNCRVEFAMYCSEFLLHTDSQINYRGELFDKNLDVEQRVFDMAFQKYRIQSRSNSYFNHMGHMKRVHKNDFCQNGPN